VIMPSSLPFLAASSPVYSQKSLNKVEKKARSMLGEHHYALPHSIAVPIPLRFKAGVTLTCSLNLALEGCVGSSPRGLVQS
jgi:hypothetical protein